MNSLEKLVRKCDNMDMLEQIHLFGDAFLPDSAKKELELLRYHQKLLLGLFKAITEMDVAKMNSVELKMRNMFCAIGEVIDEEIRE